MTGLAQPATPRNPSDGAGPVLDAIQAVGPDGATLDEMANSTGYDMQFVEIVLVDLGKNGLTTMNSDRRYQLTDFGAKARYIVAR
jgi:DNA-binding IclR family transcriptional regulator